MKIVAIAVIAASLAACGWLEKTTPRNVGIGEPVQVERKEARDP